MSDSSESEDFEIITTNKALPSHFGVMPRQNVIKAVPDNKPSPNPVDRNKPLDQKAEIFTVKIDEASKTSKNQNKIEAPPRKVEPPKEPSKNPPYNAMQTAQFPFPYQSSNKVPDAPQNLDISGLPGQNNFTPIVQPPMPPNKVFPPKNLESTKLNPLPSPIPNQFYPQIPNPNVPNLKNPGFNPLNSLNPQQPGVPWPNSNLPSQLVPKTSGPPPNESIKSIPIGKNLEPSHGFPPSNISEPQKEANILPQASPIPFVSKITDPPLFSIPNAHNSNLGPQVPPNLNKDPHSEQKLKDRQSPQLQPHFSAYPSQFQIEFNAQKVISGGFIQGPLPDNSKSAQPPKLGGSQPPSLLPNTEKIIENPPKSFPSGTGSEPKFNQPNSPEPPPKLTEDNQPFQRMAPLKVQHQRSNENPQNNTVPRLPGVAITVSSNNPNLKVSSLGNSASGQQAQKFNIPRKSNYDTIIKKIPSERILKGLQDLIQKLQPLIDINKILSNKQHFLQNLEKLHNQGCIEVKSYIDHIESLKCERCMEANIKIQLACKHNLCDDCICQLILKPSSKNPKYYIAFCPICNFEIPENQLFTILQTTDIRRILYTQNEQRKKMLFENRKLRCTQCKKDQICYFNTICYHTCMDCVADRIRLRHFDCPECGENYTNANEIATTESNCEKCQKKQYFVGDFMKTIHGGKCTLCSECLYNTNNTGICEKCNNQIFKSEKIEINHFLFSGCEICQEDSFVGYMKITMCCRGLRCEKCAKKQHACKKCGTAVEYF